MPESDHKIQIAYATPKAGAWFVYGFDVGEYPVALFDSELEALRYAVNSSFYHVTFWEFGKTWTEVKTNLQKPIAHGHGFLPPTPRY